jgi:hypothetical protein
MFDQLGAVDGGDQNSALFRRQVPWTGHRKSCPEWACRFPAFGGRRRILHAYDDAVRVEKSPTAVLAEESGFDATGILRHCRGNTRKRALLSSSPVRAGTVLFQSPVWEYAPGSNLSRYVVNRERSASPDFWQH